MTHTAPTTTETIDGIAYTSAKFPMTEQLRLLSRVVIALGERGLQAIIMANLKETGQLLPSLVAEADTKFVASAIEIAYGLSRDPTLPVDLLQRTKASRFKMGEGFVEGGGSVAANFDSHFQGELLHLAKVLIFVLRHNYLGFTLGPRSSGGSPTSEPTTKDAPSD